MFLRTQRTMQPQVMISIGLFPLVFFEKLALPTLHNRGVSVVWAMQTSLATFSEILMPMVRMKI